MTTAHDLDDQRRYLVGLAYRMLGSVADAEDMVQETFLRWRLAGEPHLDSPRAWATRTCTRLCLDRIQAVARERERYPGEWLPEPLLAGEAEDRTELDDTLSLALLMTIQRLRPTERAAFLLHDVFGYEFTEVAEIVGLEPANCRQLAARARRHLRDDRPRAQADEATVRRLADAFFTALGSGELGRLQSVLAEDVVLTADGGGKAAAARRPIVGRDAVAHFFERVYQIAGRPDRIDTHTVWFNGAPGVVVRHHGEVLAAYHFQVRDGRIDAIYVHRNPDKLARFAGVG